MLDLDFDIDLDALYSWYVGITTKIKIETWPIQFVRHNSSGTNGFFEFHSPKNQYRAITLRRSKESWDNNFSPTQPGKNPAVIWACWSHALTPPLQGYFEETDVKPQNKKELEFMAHVFKLWLLDSSSPNELTSLGKNQHPRFFEKLPDNKIYAVQSPKRIETAIESRIFTYGSGRFGSGAWGGYD